MCPNSIYVGLKVVPIREIWSQSIYFLGTWTLRVRLRTYVVSRGIPVLSANATNCTMKSAENVLVDADLAILDKPRRRVRGFGVQDLGFGRQGLVGRQGQLEGGCYTA